MIFDINFLYKIQDCNIQKFWNLNNNFNSAKTEPEENYTKPWNVPWAQL